MSSRDAQVITPRNCEYICMRQKVFHSVAMVDVGGWVLSQDYPGELREVLPSVGKCKRVTMPNMINKGRARG